MGIRYSRDTHRATNGPMIFFSDPSAEINLTQEINGAISSCLSFYSYRRPGDMMVSFGSSEGVVLGYGTPGFVIAPFSPEHQVVTIPYSPVKEMIRSAAGTSTFPSHSTTPEEHASEIQEIQRALQEIGGGKIVAARAICKEGSLDVGATFCDMCRRYPSAFVFAFSTPLTGCWIGASPELLLEGNAKGLHTMALAGTRELGHTGEWDSKNIEEQALVSEYIADCLKRHNLNPVVGDTFTKPAGSIEHLCTPIVAETTGMEDSRRLAALLSDLSPTPALSGYPKDVALKVISECENFDRSYYGGFCGPYRNPADFSFYVTLRCALAEEERYALFAGGGITLKSDAGKEWEETEMKASTICRSVCLDPKI